MVDTKYVTISQLNSYIKYVFDNNEHLKKVWLRGEISNFKRHTSGHYYLTLKDDNSRINAIMFRSNTNSLLFTPEDGMNVLVEGRVSSYPASGAYQIYIDKMQQDGVGNLYVLYEQLKKKLQSEGYFDPAHKKKIPKYPEKIGIVTAPTGAAIQDILSTIARRFPSCETILFPALVQGANAGADVARQIKEAQNYDLDVLIVGRGGGSIEDLWPFNEEVVAKAIYECKIPVISAVGHEIDYTISDYVADLRAPTPTGAAEMAVPNMLEVKAMLLTLQKSLTHSLMVKMDYLKQRFSSLKESYILKNPAVLYDIKMQKLDNIYENLEKNMLRVLSDKSLKLKSCCDHYILQNPLVLLKDKDIALQRIIETLKLINPLNILDKGYSLVKKDDKVVKDANDVLVGDHLNVTLSKGNLDVIVKEILL